MSSVKRKLKITWKRLLDKGQTCPRCASTEQELLKAVFFLRQHLLPYEIEVQLEKLELSQEEFQRNPLQSNEILIDGKPLEEWLNAQTGQSPCCSVCGPNECRTIKVGSETYETIPWELIVRASLAAVASMLEDR